MEEAKDKASKAPDLMGPLDTGMAAAFTALLMHLIVPVSGNVRRANQDWPWFDAYRLSPHSGWPSYLGAGLAVAMALGLGVGLVHWAASRVIRRLRTRLILGWLFLLIASVAGFLTPVFLHDFPRVLDRPTVTGTPIRLHRIR